MMCHLVNELAVTFCGLRKGETWLSGWMVRVVHPTCTCTTQGAMPWNGPDPITWVTGSHKTFLTRKANKYYEVMMLPILGDDKTHFFKHWSLEPLLESHLRANGPKFNHGMGTY